MVRGIQDKAYRVAGLDPPRCVRGDLYSKGEIPPSDRSEDSGLYIRPLLPGELGTSTSSSGWATLVPVKVGSLFKLRGSLHFPILHAFLYTSRARHCT